MLDYEEDKYPNPFVMGRLVAQEVALPSKEAHSVSEREATPASLLSGSDSNDDDDDEVEEIERDVIGLAEKNYRMPAPDNQFDHDQAEKGS